MREGDGLLLNYGGKSRIAHKLVPHFPKGPQCFVDLFFGGGGIYWSVPSGLYPIRVINDLNKSIVTFYKVLRERPEELREVCSLTPYAFDEQRACRDPAGDPEDNELELARRVWVRQRQNFGGRQHPAAGWRRGDHRFSPSHTTNEILGEFLVFADRMRAVEINNTTALDLVEHYGESGVFLYADPPYYPETRGTNNDYACEMSPEEHAVLAEKLKAAVANGADVAISGYNCEFYQDTYKDWRRVEYAHNVGSANFAAVEQRARTECMWMSYPKEREIGPSWFPTAKPKNAKERALMRFTRR